MSHVISAVGVGHWQNPFVLPADQTPLQAYGREELLRRLIRRLTDTDPASINLVGPRRIGKTTVLRDLGNPAGCWRRTRLAAAIAPRLAPEHVIPLYQDLAGCPADNPLADLTEALFTALERRRECDLQAVADELQLDKTAVQLDRAGVEARLHALARAAHKGGLRLALCLDHVDKARLLDDSRTQQRINELAQYASLVLASQHPLIDIFPGLAGSPLVYRMERLDVRLLEPATAAEALVAAGTELQFSQGDKALLLEMVGRHPYVLRRGAATAYEHLAVTAGQPLTRNFIWQTVNSALEVIFQYLWNHWGGEIGQFLALRSDPGTDWDQVVGRTFIHTLQDEAIIAEDAAAAGRLAFFSPLFEAFAVRRAGEAPVEADGGTAATTVPAPDAVLADLRLAPRTKTAQLFAALWARPGQIVPDDELARAVWPTKEPATVKHALELTVAALRKRLDDSRAAYRILRKYGQGYLLAQGEPAGAEDTGARTNN